MLLMVACCFIFTACNNKTAETEEPTTDTTAAAAEQPKEEACCPMMKDWAEFDKKTDEEKAALVEKRAEFINKVLADLKIDEIECPKAKEELPKFVEKWNKEFTKATLEGKKALIDEFDTFKCLHPKKDCCKSDCNGENKCENKCKEENCKDCKNCCQKDGKKCECANCKK